MWITEKETFNNILFPKLLTKKACLPYRKQKNERFLYLQTEILQTANILCKTTRFTSRSVSFSKHSFTLL